MTIVKQYGATNLADIGTKALGGPRFAELRKELGRLPLDSEAKRATAEKAQVGMVSAASGGAVAGGGVDSALAGLMVLLSLIGKAAANRECDSDYSLVKTGEQQIVSVSGFVSMGTQRFAMALGMVLAIGTCIE